MIDSRQKLLVVKSTRRCHLSMMTKELLTRGPPLTLTMKSETTYYYEANFKILLNNELLFRKNSNLYTYFTTSVLRQI